MAWHVVTCALLIASAHASCNGCNSGEDGNALLQTKTSLSMEETSQHLGEDEDGDEDDQGEDHEEEDEEEFGVPPKPPNCPACANECSTPQWPALTEQCKSCVVKAGCQEEQGEDEGADEEDHGEDQDEEEEEEEEDEEEEEEEDELGVPPKPPNCPACANECSTPQWPALTDQCKSCVVKAGCQEEQGEAGGFQKGIPEEDEEEEGEEKEEEGESGRSSGCRPSALGKYIAKFAKSYKGRKAYSALQRSASCWDLAYAALESAKKKGYKPKMPNLRSPYVWSSSVVSITQAQPGDIAQFKGWRQSYKGYSKYAWNPHTAVVTSCYKNGALTTYEQNPNPVAKGVYRPRYKTSGSVTIYRIKKSSGSSSRRRRKSSPRRRSNKRSYSPRRRSSWSYSYSWR